MDKKMMDSEMRRLLAAGWDFNDALDFVNRAAWQEAQLNKSDGAAAPRHQQLGVVRTVVPFRRSGG